MHIRTLAAQDAAIYRDLRLQALASNPEAFLTTYDDYVNRPMERVAGQLEPTDHNWTFGAFSDDGKLTGTVTLIRETALKIGHIGSVQAMYVTGEFRKQGIGRRLLQHLIEEAKQRPGIEQLKLTVVKDNAPAVRLYESLGFQVYGLEPRALKTGGRYWDELLMILLISST